jgi:phage baseplate assembly protein W
MAENPHFDFPFRRGVDGSVCVVEQDTPEHIMACENVIIRCPLGWRDERPEFGWDFPEFRNVMDLDHLRHALIQFEPRSDVNISEKRLQDLVDPATREISVDVEVDS